MRGLLTTAVSLVLLGAGNRAAAQTSVTTTGNGVCIQLPVIGQTCLSLPALPGNSSGAATPSVPVGAIPTATEPAPTTATPDEGVADSAAQKGGDSAPDYSGLQLHLFHFPDIRLEAIPQAKVPYLSVNNPAQDGDNEWIVPYSQESGSVTAATAMRRSWQRFEDRYYWRAMVELNNPSLYITNCIINFNTGLQTKQLSARVTVSPSEVGRDPLIDNKYPFTQPDTLALDSYYPFPQVSNADYCSGLSPNLIPEIPVMYLPGVCFTIFGSPTGICIEGSKTNTTNPLAPAPIMFNDGLARQRIVNAIKKAHTDYLKEYQSDIVNSLFNTNNKYFFPLPWRSLIPNDGAVIAPLMNQNVSVRPMTDLANLVKQTYQGEDKSKLFALNSFPYYFQSLYRSPTLSLHLLPRRKDVLNSPPGVWLFEEYKRTLPVTNLPFQEQFGYTTFFEAYNELRVTLLPEDFTAKLMHPILYYATGVLQDLTGYSVILPQPMRIPEYMAGLPFAGPQGRYDWKSVPEGYQIPRVKGQPLFDYEAVR